MCIVLGIVWNQISIHVQEIIKHTKGDDYEKSIHLLTPLHKQGSCQQNERCSHVELVRGST